MYPTDSTRAPSLSHHLKYYPEGERGRFIAPSWAAVRLGTRIFSSKADYSAAVLANFHPARYHRTNVAYRLAPRKLHTAHLIKRHIAMSDIALSDAAEGAYVGLGKRKRVAEVVSWNARFMFLGEDSEGFDAQPAYRQRVVDQHESWPQYADHLPEWSADVNMSVAAIEDMAVDEEEPAEAAPMVLEELSEEQAVDVVEQTMALDDGDDMEDVEQGPPAYSIVMDAPILAFPVATEQAQPTVFLVDEDDKMVGSSAVDDIADYEDTFDVEMYGSSPVLALQETLDVVPAITAISKFEVDKFLSTVPLPSAAVDVVVPDAPQPVSVAPPSSEEAFPEFVAPEACISGPEDAAHLAESAETSTAHKTREGKQRATPRETHVVEPKAALEAKADEFLSSIVLPPGAVDGATHESPQPAFVASGSSEDELPDYVEPEASMGGSVEAASAPYKVREGKQRADPRLMDEVDRSDDAVDGGNTETADDTAEEQDYREKNEVKDEAAKKPIVWVLSKSSLRVKRAPGELPRRDPVVDALAESLGRSSIVDPAA